MTHYPTKAEIDGGEDEIIKKDCYKLKELVGENIEFVVDIGGCIGTTSRLILELFPNAKIIICEPVKELMDYIKEATSNKLIYIQKAVVGDDREFVNFNITEWNGSHHIDGKFPAVEYGNKIVDRIQVPCTTLKKIIKENNLSRIDLLKVDGEGIEPEVLESIKDFLGDIKYIRGEWHTPNNLEKILKILKDTHNTTVTTEPSFRRTGEFFANLK